MDRALNYLGMARKAGLLETGEENSGTVVRSGKAKVLLLASDASDNAKRRAEGFVQGSSTPLIRLPYTKAQISAATGKNGCSMAVFTDIGLANSFLKALAEFMPDEYGSISEDIEQKNEKANRRKREAAAHDRNKKMGKKTAEHRSDRQRSGKVPKQQA